MSEDTHDHSGPHVTPLSLLFGIGGTLLFLTGVTVWVTYIDLGRSGNLAVAMVIATIKAVMVGAYFMHLKWDRPFNVIIFTSCFLFVGLFFAMAYLDKSQYEDDIQDMMTEEGK